jgi:hypothetical protein
MCTQMNCRVFELAVHLRLTEVTDYNSQIPLQIRTQSILTVATASRKNILGRDIHSVKNFMEEDLCVRFEDFTAVTMKNAVFWYVNAVWLL